jgi:hypothetical protein
LCFSIFKHFGSFHGNDSHFEKNQPLKAQLLMAYDIPTKFHPGISQKSSGQKCVEEEEE